MITNTVKTYVLFGVLTLLLIYAGKAVSSEYGIFIGIILSIAINTFIYFHADKLLLSFYKVSPITPHNNSQLYQQAHELCKKMNIPLPKLWYADLPIANAFATGRNPKNASVVFTTKLLDILNPSEIRGILAHELSHVKNRDTLLTTVASTMAGAVGYIGYMLRQGALVWRPKNKRETARTPVTNLLLALILPVGATLLRLAISRSREFNADYTGAVYSKDPLALASALEKLDLQKKEGSLPFVLRHPRTAMTEPLFILNPFATHNAFLGLLSTHPPIEERIRRLKELYQQFATS